MRKKAQAAMEFLMTYGWAILVVLAAIAALAYFGVLSPDRFLPNKCQLPSGFGCVDFVYYAPGNITLVLQNGAGFDATVDNIAISDCGTTTPNVTHLRSGMGYGAELLPSNLWRNGDKAYAEFDCAGNTLSEGQKFQGVIKINYTTVNGLPKSAVGDLIVKAE